MIFFVLIIQAHDNEKLISLLLCFFLYWSFKRMTMRILAPLHCVFFCSSHSSAQRGGVRHLVIVFCFAPCCHVFFLFQSLKLNRCFICFMMLVRKFVLFCFVVFTTLVDVNLKKKKDYWRRGGGLNYIGKWHGRCHE